MMRSAVIKSVLTSKLVNVFEAKRSEVLRRFVRSEGLELIRAGEVEAFERLVAAYKE